MSLFFKRGLFAKQQIGLEDDQESSRPFIKDDDGTTAIEFALLATPFLGFLYALLAIGYIYLNATVFEDATQQASRKIRTGEVTETNLTKDGFKKLICSEILIPEATCLNEMIIDVTSNEDLSQLNTKTPESVEQQGSSQETYDPGVGLDYVIVKAYLPFESMNGLFSLLNSGPVPKLVLSSVEVFRNEPFSSSP